MYEKATLKLKDSKKLCSDAESKMIQADKLISKKKTADEEMEIPLKVRFCLVIVR